MGRRRQARECALQMLFQLDVTGDAPDEVMRSYFEPKTVVPEVRDLACRLFRSAAANRDRIDGMLRQASSHWRVERMAVVDRNVLRLGIGEALLAPDAPPKVVINEAVEIARRFSGEQAAHFVNGVLDAVLIHHGPQGLAPAESG